MGFNQILGQERLKKNLERALENQQVVHAYLLQGEEGLGKRAIAQELAKGIACRGQGKRPCNSCISCRKVEGGNHPEVRWIGGDKSIGIEAIRQIQRDFQRKAYEGRKKVAIIVQGDKMTIQAQNALLKTLEEPAKHGTIIILTDKTASLLPTIISRCQRIKLYPLARETIKDFLIEEKGIEPEEANLVASLSKGIVGEALKLIEDKEYKERRDKTIGISRSLIDKNLIGVLEEIQFFLDERQYIEEILETLLIWYRDILVYKTTRDDKYIINIDRLEEISYQVEELTINNINQMLEIIDKAKENLRSNINYRLNLEAMLLRLKKNIDN